MLNRFCLLDLETVGAPDAEQWLGEITAPKNYTKADSIATYVAEERVSLLNRAGLDPDLCQIVCFGMQNELDHQPHITLVMNEQQEIFTLEFLWKMVGPNRPIVGYGLTWFDLGVLVRRSQLLGVTVPAWVYKQGKYRHDVVVELADYLTLNGMIEQKKGRGLDYHCQRFGIHVEDATSGKDIATLWKDGQVEAIKQHNRADLERIRRVAERLGVIEVSVQQELVAEGTGIF